MSTEPPFGEIAARLCYLRRGSQEGELEIPVDSDGFLDAVTALMATSTELTPGALVDPATVVESGALVLLGEPGVGKSTAFEAIIEGLDSRVVHVDGAELTHATFEERLGRHLRALPRAGDDHAELVVVVDQLDESPIVRSMARPLRRALQGRDVSGLRLLVACRTADYPAAITDALTSSNIEVYLADLAPLTRTQAENLAASVPGVDGVGLVSAAIEAGAGMLASVPLTLSMLVRTYMKEQRLEPDPRLLFADGVVQLADEPDDIRRSQFETSTEQRVAVAGRTAARLLLTARRTLWRGAQLEAGPLDLRAESLVGGPEVLPNGSSVDVTSSTVDETLATAVFTGSGDSRLAFRHSSIAAYLAASHLVSRRVPRRQLEALFLVAGFEGIRTIPTLLRETAAWLVTLDPENTKWLVDADPLSFAAHGRIVDSPMIRALIVEALLERAGEIELSDVPWARSPRRLAHEGLADQLRGVLGAAGAEEPAGWSGIARVRLAVRLAREAVVPGLADELLQIVESDAWSPHLRQLAALAAFDTEESTSAGRLVNVLRRLEDSTHATEVDPDDELRGTLLSLLWPDHITVDGLLPHLRPRRNRDLFGSYLVLESTFPEALDEGDVPTVVAWAREVVEAGDERTVATESEGPAGSDSERQLAASRIDDELLDGLVDRALAGPSAKKRTADVAALVLPRLRRHEHVLMPIPVDLVDQAGHEPDDVRDLRRSLTSELLKRVASDDAEGRADTWLVSDGWSPASVGPWTRDAYIPQGLMRAGRSRLLTADDFTWAYEEAAEADHGGDEELRDQFTEVAVSLFDRSNVSNIDLVDSDHAHPVWERLRYLFDAIDLDSEQATTLRDSYRRARDQDDEPPAHVAQFADQQRRRLLDAQNGDPQAFWQLLWGLQFPPDTLRGHLRLDDDVTSYPGMAVFPDVDGAIRRLTAAATTYLTRENDHRDDWLGTNQYDRRAWSAYIALALLARQQHLDRVPSLAWKDWVGAIVWFSAVPANTGDEDIKVELLRRAADHAPTELADAAARYLRGELARGNSASEMRLIDPSWAPSLADTWRQLLSEIVDAVAQTSDQADEQASSNSSGQIQLPATDEAQNRAESIWADMLTLLLQADPEAADIAVSQLPNGDADAVTHPLGVRAALTLLTHDAGRWWPDIHERANAWPDFARDLALAAAGASDDRPMLKGLAEGELAQLYRWLSELFPPDEDREFSGVHFVGPDEEARRWRDRVLHELSERGGDTENAVRELARLAAEYPDRLLVKSNLVRARTLLGESGWLPPEPDELARLLDDARRRLVRSNAELAEVLLEVLETVATDVGGHGDLLWDRVPKRLAEAGPAVWLPKPEAAVSAYLTNELRHRLADRQVVVNREVLVRPTDEYGAGDSTDILVETPTVRASLTSGTARRAAAVVEVKGAWNPELQTAQRTQLAVRYLPESDTDCGIYVVAWFPLELWTDMGDYRRSRAARIDCRELQGQLREQADDIHADLQVTTYSFLLRLPRAHRASYQGEADSDDAEVDDSYEESR